MSQPMTPAAVHKQYDEAVTAFRRQITDAAARVAFLLPNWLSRSNSSPTELTISFLDRVASTEPRSTLSRSSDTSYRVSASKMVVPSRLRVRPSRKSADTL